jgi:hypothetical protein
MDDRVATQLVKISSLLLVTTDSEMSAFMLADNFNS